MITVPDLTLDVSDLVTSPPLFGVPKTVVLPPEIDRWCYETLGYWRVTQERVPVKITSQPQAQFCHVALMHFANEADLLLFKLRWL